MSGPSSSPPLAPRPSPSRPRAPRLKGAGRQLRRLILPGQGAVAALGLPPLHIFPLSLLAFAALWIALERAEGPRRGFICAGAFAFGFFAGGLWWIAAAFSYELSGLRYFAVPAVIALVVLLSLFWAAAGALTAAFPRGPARLLAFPACFLLAELARASLGGGFPWNPPASVWSFSALALQPLAWAGTDLWGAATFFAVAGAAVLLHGRGKGRGRRRGGATGPGAGPEARRETGRGERALAAAALALPLLVLAAGAVRLALAPAPGSEVRPGVVLRLVQPAVSQRDKWRSDKRYENLSRQVALLHAPGAYSHAVLPEAAVVWPLNSAARVRAALAAPVFDRAGSGSDSAPSSALPDRALLTGGITRLQGAEAGGGEEALRLHNSLYVLGAGGAVEARYDKHRLVPFGEYTPLAGLAPFFRLAEGQVDYAPGPGPAVLEAPGLPPFAPLICFEAVFSGRLAPPAGFGAPRPAWLLNVTNDAWFGRTAGPYQHFAAARMRAAEEGLAMVRAANSGISGVIDGHGRVLASLPLGAAGKLDSFLPEPLPPPFFARHGRVLPFAAASLFLGLAAATAAAVRRRARRGPEGLAGERGGSERDIS